MSTTNRKTTRRFATARRGGRVLTAIFILLLAGATPGQADSLVRRGEERTGPVTQVALTNLTVSGPSRVVAAVRQGDGRLKLIVWDITNGGSFNRRGDHLGPPIREVAITALSSSRVAVALRKSDGTLGVQVFDVTGNGGLTPRGTGGGGTVRGMAILALGPDSFVTAVRGNGDRLKVIRWKVGSAGLVGRDGEADSIEIEGDLAMAGTPSSVTAVANDDGNLRLLNWWQGGSTGLTRGGVGTGGPISLVGIVGDGGFGGTWVTATTDPGPTAVRTGRFGGGRKLIGAGTLKLIAWELEETSIPSDLGRRGEVEVTGTGGITFDLAMAPAEPGNLVVTATSGVGTYRRLLERDQGKPHLKLTVWKPLSSSIEKRAEATLGGKYESLALAAVRNPQGNLHRFVTAVRGEGDVLKLNVWDFAP